MSIVLLGQIGSGKTSLYNKITNSQENFQSGGKSVTRNVIMKQSCFGQGFLVLDTPGFGSESDKLDHIAGVLSALSEGPINIIAIIVKYTRTNVIMEDVKKVLPAFINYRNLITVIITCWDFCEEDQKETNKKDIQQRLAQFKINSVMFVRNSAKSVGQNDTPQSLCLQLDQIIARSKAENVTLTENDIFKNFDLTDYDEGEIFEIEMEKETCITFYNKFFKQAIKLINENNVSKGLLADYCYAITQFAKQTLESTILSFESKKLQTIDKLNPNEQIKAFQVHFQLKNSIFKDYEYIVDTAHKKTHNGNNFSKYIRKCYHCGEIWFKAAGCNGQTICGRLNDNNLDDFIKQEEPPHKYIVTYNKEILEVKPNESVKPKAIVLDEKSKQNLETKVKTEQMTLGSETFKVGGAGCKRIIDWGQMKPLTEEELKLVLSILDNKLCEKMVEAEKLTQQKILNQQLTYKDELDKKLKEQKKNIIKAV